MAGSIGPARKTKITAKSTNCNSCLKELVRGDEVYAVDLYDDGEYVETLLYDEIECKIEHEKHLLEHHVILPEVIRKK